MTAAQSLAFDQIREIMREHFKAGVVIVEGELEDDNESDVRATWHGGYATSIGLLELGKLQVWKTPKDNSE